MRRCRIARRVRAKFYVLAADKGLPADAKNQRIASKFVLKKIILCKIRADKYFPNPLPAVKFKTTNKDKMPKSFQISANFTRGKKRLGI